MNAIARAIGLVVIVLGGVAPPASAQSLARLVELVTVPPAFRLELLAARTTRIRAGLMIQMLDEAIEGGGRTPEQLAFLRGVRATASIAKSLRAEQQWKSWLAGGAAGPPPPLVAESLENLAQAFTLFSREEFFELLHFQGEVGDFGWCTDVMQAGIGPPPETTGCTSACTGKGQWCEGYPFVPCSGVCR